MSNTSNPSRFTAEKRRGSPFWASRSWGVNGPYVVLRDLRLTRREATALASILNDQAKRLDHSEQCEASAVTRMRSWEQRHDQAVAKLQEAEALLETLTAPTDARTALLEEHYADTVRLNIEMPQPYVPGGPHGKITVRDGLGGEKPAAISALGERLAAASKLGVVGKTDAR